MPRQLEKSSRELPIPIDNFEIMEIPCLPEILPEEEGRIALDDISLWVSIGRKVTYKQLEELMLKDRTKAVRINISKFYNAVEDLLRLIRQFNYYREKFSKEISLCLDVNGPKIRVTNLKDVVGKDYIDISKGDIICIVYIEDYKKKRTTGGILANKKVLPIDAPLPLMEAESQGYVFVSDGWQQLEIIKAEGELLYCKALHDAFIYDKRGINIVGKPILSSFVMLFALLSNLQFRSSSSLYNTPQTPTCQLNELPHLKSL